MAISVFPAGGGEFVTNDFVVDMNDTSNNVIDLGRSYAEGAYDISLATGDTSFDIYAINADGNSVGYTNDATLVCSAGFTQLAILGVSQTERLTFAFSGASNDATAEGTATGGGAYLEDATPSDLPNQDDTTTVTGGNFASDVQIFFESGATSTAAKNITRNDSTELIVTRPDALDPNLDPWSLRAVNPGVPEPTGSDANILADVIDAGALPVWVTTSPIDLAVLNQGYSFTLEATDADGSVSYAVTTGNLPTGLTLNSSTGEISGTPSSGSETFTVTATDEGNNSNSREFVLSVASATGGSITSVDGYVVHTFNSSDDLEVLQEIQDVEYIILAGGGGGGEGGFTAGGGGGGGLLSSISGFQSGEDTAALPSQTLTAGTYPVTVGAGGSLSSEGADSSLGNIGTAVGGGAGMNSFNAGTDGGCGGGSGSGFPASSGTTGQGFGGGTGGGASGGGGTHEVSANTNPNIANQSTQGGAGTHNFLDQRGWGAGGGAKGANSTSIGGGSSGNDQTTYAGDINQSPIPNFGGGGSGSASGEAGASGKVVVRYV